MIFGPGSEWFWSMAQFVLVAVTLIGIYYQLRIARNANAFEQMSRIADEGASETAAEERRCRARQTETVGERFAAERPLLAPLPARPFLACTRHPVRASAQARGADHDRAREDLVGEHLAPVAKPRFDVSTIEPALVAVGHDLEDPVDARRVHRKSS